MLGNANKNRGSSVFASEHNTIKTEIPMMIVELRHVIPARERGGFLPERRNRPPRVVREASTSRLCASRSPLGAPGSVGKRASQYRRGWAGLAMKGQRNQFSSNGNNHRNREMLAMLQAYLLALLTSSLYFRPPRTEVSTTTDPRHGIAKNAPTCDPITKFCAHTCVALYKKRERKNRMFPPLTKKS